jgi:hypothetical protein
MVLHYQQLTTSQTVAVRFSPMIKIYYKKKAVEAVRFSCTTSIQIIGGK